MVKPGVHRLAEKLTFARRMRKNPTSAEATIWQAVRRGALGFRVRRQVRIYGYIVDFYAPLKNLIIEVDGDYHTSAEQVSYDKTRTNVLLSKGFRIIRFTNDQAISKTKEVLQQILAFDDQPRRARKRRPDA